MVCESSSKVDTRYLGVAVLNVIYIYPCRRFEGGGGGGGGHADFSQRIHFKTDYLKQGKRESSHSQMHFQPFPGQIIYFLIFSQIFRDKSIFQFSETNYFFQNEHDLPPR